MEYLSDNTKDKFNLKYVQTNDDHNCEQFWGSRIQDLFKSFRIIPMGQMTENEKINAFTRLILIITLILYFYNYTRWKQFLVFGLLLSIVWYASSPSNNKALTANFKSEKYFNECLTSDENCPDFVSFTQLKAKHLNNTQDNKNKEPEPVYLINEEKINEKVYEISNKNKVKNTPRKEVKGTSKGAISLKMKYKK